MRENDSDPETAAVAAPLAVVEKGRAVPSRGRKTSDESGLKEELDIQGKELRRRHGEFEHSFRGNVISAALAGRAIKCVKRLLRHGAFLEWLHDQAGQQALSARSLLYYLTTWNKLDPLLATLHSASPNAKLQRDATSDEELLRQHFQGMSSREIRRLMTASRKRPGPGIKSTTTLRDIEAIVTAGDSNDSEARNTSMDPEAVASPVFYPSPGELREAIEHAIREFESGKVRAAYLLVPAQTDRDWFRPLRRFPLALFRNRVEVPDHRDPSRFTRSKHPLLLVFIGAASDTPTFATRFAHLADVFTPFSFEHCFWESQKGEDNGIESIPGPASARAAEPK